MSETLDQMKKHAREQAGQAREIAHNKLASTASVLLTDSGLDFLGKIDGKIVSGFMPYRSEINVLGLLGRVEENGGKTCLPIVTGQGQPLEFRLWKPGDETEPGKWKIPVPLPQVKTVDPDILLVPLLSFDLQGYRLGYGGGFYDRTIEKLKHMKQVTTIGVAYSAQQVKQVPRGKYDQQLDWILTEKGPIQCV